MELQESITSLDIAPIENIDEQREEILKLTDQLLLSAAEELSLDAEDIQRASSACGLDPATSQSMAAFASTAEHIKEIIQETLKGRDLDPNNANPTSNNTLDSLPGEDGIRQRIADLEKVIQSNSRDSFISEETGSSPGKKEKDEQPDCTGLDVTPDNNNSAPAEAESRGVDLIQSNQQEGFRAAQPPLESTVVQESAACCVTQEEPPLMTPDPTPEQHLTNSQTTISKPSEGAVEAPVAPISLPSEDKAAATKINQKPKKGEKTAEQILKSLGSAGSVQDRLLVLCRRHAETLEELRGSESRQKGAERQVTHLSREKELLQADHNRNVLARSRLEGLCRELQRQNKAVKEESLLRIREEEEKRREISGKFQGTLGDISSLLQDNKQRDAQLREENLQLAAKLKVLVQHYETWEKHMEKVVQQKELEAQLSKARLGKALLQSQGEREQALIEKQHLLENMAAMQEKATQLSTSELQLRTELALYTNKYQEFQGVLTKSNQVFATFKGDMEKMSKKIKILEKETVQWKSKWETSNRSLVQMATDKQKRDGELSTCQQRVATLEKLCRALQGERNALQDKLKAEIPEENYCHVPQPTSAATSASNVGWGPRAQKVQSGHTEGVPRKDNKMSCNEANCEKRDCCPPVAAETTPSG